MLARVPPPPSSFDSLSVQSEQRRGNDGIERYVLREVDNHAQGFLKFRNVAGVVHIATSFLLVSGAT